MANGHEGQNRSWEGDQGQWWADNATRNEFMLGVFTPHLLAAAAITSGDAVLDVGCGAGVTTIEAAGVARLGSVTGVDLSETVVELARREAAEAGVANLDFLVADAGSHPFVAAHFDRVISRFGVMFFDDPVRAFANLGRAMRAGGRLAFLCWQPFERNGHAALPLRVVARHLSLPPPADQEGPWSLADPDTTRSVLGDAGFTDVSIEGIEAKVRVGADVDDTLSFYLSQPMARSCMTASDPALVQEVIAAIRAELEPYALSEGVMLDAAVWIVTARR